MKRINNVFCALLILTTVTICSSRADDSNFEKVIRDYRLQLATFSILNTDTPVQIGIPTNEKAASESSPDAPTLKMIPISTLNSSKNDQPQPQPKEDTEAKSESEVEKSEPEVKQSEPEVKQSEPEVKKSVSKPDSAPIEKTDPKTEKASTENVSKENASKEVKPEKVVNQTPDTTSSPKTSEAEKASPAKEDAPDGWNSVSRQKVSILETESQPAEPQDQSTSPQPQSNLPEPQELFEDEDNAANASPNMESIDQETILPEPDESLSPILEDDFQFEGPKSLKPDTRMLDLVNDGLKKIDEQTLSGGTETNASNDEDENELELPTGADKFTFNPFAAAAKSKLETVNNIEVHVLEFESLVPGVTTIEKAVSRWGEPNNKMENKSTSVYQYFRPIKNVASEVQVIFEGGKLTTVLIQFEQPETIENLEAQYDLAGIKPIVVYQKDGTAVGQAYPERGASLVYAAQSDNQKTISRLILEPINTMPFILRAESSLKDDPAASKADLEYVLNKDPRNAQAQWLYGRVLVSFGELDTAIEHLEKAVFLDNDEARFYISLSLARAEAGLTDLADKAADKAIELADQKDNPSPHLAAEAWRIKGDLETNKQTPNFKAALDLHSKAIVMAQQQLSNPQAEIAQAALETLVSAHLGAARDIAWGNWNQKASAVVRWLNQANVYNEQLIKTAHYSERQIYQSRILVASKALSAIAGVGKEINPVDWAELLTENGDKLLMIIDSPKEKERLMWNIGMSLYDAVQVFQSRKDDEMTLKYGQKAVECLEASSTYANKTTGKVSAGDLYIQGRLYFRLGAIYAISHNDHQQAVKWYSKSLPIFETVADAIPRVELGRLGETLVSMGVSYWETGKQNQAVNLTENGIYCLEQAAEEGFASTNSLEIPYRNLSMMLNYMGKTQESSQYIKKAEALRSTVR